MKTWIKRHRRAVQYGGIAFVVALEWHIVALVTSLNGPGHPLVTLIAVPGLLAGVGHMIDRSRIAQRDGTAAAEPARPFEPMVFRSARARLSAD